MPDPLPNIDTGEDAGVGPGRASRPRVPRWQKVVGIVGLVVLLLVGARMLGGGGFDHGPGGDTRPAETTEDRDQTPPDDGGHNPSGGWNH